MPVPALIRELSEPDPEGRLWFTGEFTVDIDGPEGRAEFADWPAALEWAAHHRDVVWVDFEYEGRYTARGHDATPDGEPGYSPPLPSEYEVRLSQGRRRPIRDAWLDRSERDAPTDWEVAVTADPDVFEADILEEAERVGGLLAAGLEGAGCSDVSWADDGLERFTQMEVAEGEGWTFSGRIGIKATGRVQAATHRSVERFAVNAVREVLDAENHRMPHRVPSGDRRAAWDARVFVHPPGYEAPFGTRYPGEPTVGVPPDVR